MRKFLLGGMAALGIVGSGLSACGVKYVEPPSHAPAATLRFEYAVTGGLVDGIMSTRFRLQEGPYGSLSVGEPLVEFQQGYRLDKTAPVERRFSALQPIYVSAFTMNDQWLENTYCSNGFVMTPVAGHTYRVRQEFNGFGCRVTVFDETLGVADVSLGYFDTARHTSVPTSSAPATTAP